MEKMTMPVIDLLKAIPLFESFNNSELRHLASLLKGQSLDKGEILFHKGDTGSAFFIIANGLIRISVSNKAGDEVTFAHLRGGDFFGEMALLDEQTRSADATALEDSTLYVLDRNDFFPFLFENENAVHSILRALSMRLRRTDDILAETAFLTVSSRLARRLLELAEPSQLSGRESAEYQVRMSQRELGAMPGVTRESINKELKILKDRGIITTSRGNIGIQDMERLKCRTQ